MGAEDAFAVIFKQCQGLASSDGFRCGAPALPAEATEPGRMCWRLTLEGAVV